MTMEITEPLTLSVGWHGGGQRDDARRGCAMEVLSWTMGDTDKNDNPLCTAPVLAQAVQNFNDLLGMEWGLYPVDHQGNVWRSTQIELQPEHAMMAIELAISTVGTGRGEDRHYLNSEEMARWSQVSWKRFSKSPDMRSVGSMIASGHIDRAYRLMQVQIQTYKDLFCPIPPVRVPTGAEVDAALRRLQDA